MNHELLALTTCPRCSIAAFLMDALTDVSTAAERDDRPAPLTVQEAVERAMEPVEGETGGPVQGLQLPEPRPLLQSRLHETE